MRATINFDVDVDRVNDTMRELVSTQVEYLIDAAQCIERGANSQNLLEVLSESLKNIEKEAAQLRQYRDMLSLFEKARLEMILPQAVESEDSSPPIPRNVGERIEAAGNMKNFDSFLEKVNQQEKEEEKNNDPEEG